MSSSGNTKYSYGIYNDNIGEISINKGTINSSSSYSAGCSYGIYNNSTGDVAIGDGTVSSNGNSSYGIYNNSTGNIEISDGTVSSSGSSSYGIYNYNKGIITVGVKGDGLISNINPTITATKTGSQVAYGLYNVLGTFNFYDGIISGTTLAIYDIITEYEDNTTPLYNADKTEVTLSTEDIALARIKNIDDEEYTEYTNLQQAIDQCLIGQTIEILKGIEYTINDEALMIAQDKNITIDLNGKKITSAIPNNVIENNGILKIMDSVGGGIIVTSEETTIYNKEDSTLTLIGGAIDNRKTQAVFNKGTLIIDGGNINYKDSSIYGVYNDGIGNIQVKSGTLSNNSSNFDTIYGIYNNSTGEIEVSGGTISCFNSNSNLSSNKQGYSFGIYNKEEGFLKVNGGTVRSEANSGKIKCYGIYNSSRGNIEISEGTISSNNNSSGLSYGIYNSSRGNIEMRGGTISSKSNSDSNYGVYNVGDGILNYYGGIIQTYNHSNRYDSDYGIYNKLTSIEENKYIVVTEINNYKVISLEEIIENVAVIGNTEYSTINEAIEELDDTTGMIKLIKNTDMVKEIIINSNQNITIDLNGYTLNSYFTIKNRGNLRIVDNSADKTGKIVSIYNTVIENQGILNMNGGTISDAVYAIENSGNINVDGVNFNNNEYGIYNRNSGTATIVSGNITLNTYGVYNSSGNITLESGNINSNTYGVYNLSGNITIVSGNINSSTYGIYSSSGTTIIYGGNIDTNDYGVYISSGTVNINSNGISNNGYGVYNSSGTLKVLEGAEISSTNVGIQNASGTVYIGESGTVNKNSPIIVGENYGLVNGQSAYVYFYDGQIKGKQGATQGFITSTESGYRVANKQEGEYLIDYLALVGTMQTVAEVNGVEYSNLQSAINACNEGEMITITLTNGIETDATFTIGEGKTIILDMNEKTISSSVETTIINQGNLTIIDSTSSGVGKISNTNSNGICINNAGTLTLGEDDGTVSQNLITIEGETYGIINSGTLNFYDGVIKGGSALSGTVTSKPSEYVISTTTSGGKEMYFLTR